jgi:pimeloyl-ACP methyl ester carboxylesterase
VSSVTTTDGTPIYYKDWGTGQPVVFSHGWVHSADSWEGWILRKTVLPVIAIALCGLTLLTLSACDGSSVLTRSNRCFEL